MISAGEEDVEDALRLLDHLSIERTNVVRYSRGSEIASRLVAQHPNRFRSVVFGGWAAGHPVETLELEDCLTTATSLARGVMEEHEILVRAQVRDRREFGAPEATWTTPSPAGDRTRGTA